MDTQPPVFPPQRVAPDSSIPNPQSQPIANVQESSSLPPSPAQEDAAKKKKRNYLIGGLLVAILLIGLSIASFLGQNDQDIRQQADTCNEQCPGSDGVLRSCHPAEGPGNSTDSICNSSFVGRTETCGPAYTEFCCNGSTWSTDMGLCTVASPSPTPSPSPSPSPSPAICNSACSTNSYCQQTNPDWFCYSNSCRLIANPSSNTCTEPSPSPTPSPSPSPTPSPTPTTSPTPSPTPTVSPSPTTTTSPSPSPSPTPTVSPSPTSTTTVATTTTPQTLSCNSVCNTNAECQNADTDYICYQGVCRLSSNPTSQSCVYTNNTTTQPVLPAELPETGSEDIMNWIKAGLGTLGLGAALLLLL